MQNSVINRRQQVLIKIKNNFSGVWTRSGNKAVHIIFLGVIANPNTPISAENAFIFQI